MRARLKPLAMLAAGAAGFGLSVAIAAGAQGVTAVTAAEVPPTISGASLTHARFRVASRSTAVTAQAPRGTSFRFTLSTAASMQIAITRLAPGLRHGAACVAPTTGLRQSHARRCTRTLGAGTLTRSHEPAGAASVPFSGRIGSRALRPGSYGAVLTAHSAGGLSAPTALRFTVVQ